jgi:hypothetical protein
MTERVVYRFEDANGSLAAELIDSPMFERAFAHTGWKVVERIWPDTEVVRATRRKTIRGANRIVELKAWAERTAGAFYGPTRERRWIVSSRG